MNTLDGRFYIGVHKTNNPNDGYLGSGLHLSAAVKKHGRKVFKKEILFVFETSEEAYAKEKELVTRELIESGQVYNLATGGVPSIDWLNGERKKTALYGEAHPQWGKKRTEEQCRSISESLKKTWAENNQKLMEGAAKTAAKKRGVPSPLRGTSQTAESNLRRSESHKALTKVECPYCQGLISPQNFSKYHGEKCPIFTGKPSRSKAVRDKLASLTPMLGCANMVSPDKFCN